MKTKYSKNLFEDFVFDKNGNEININNIPNDSKPIIL